MASKLRPASSGRCAVAEAGMASPWTWEKLTPPARTPGLRAAPGCVRRHRLPAAGIFNKRRAIHGAQLLTEVVLELEQKSFYLRGIGFH